MKRKLIHSKSYEAQQKLYSNKNICHKYFQQQNNK